MNRCWISCVHNELFWASYTLQVPKAAMFILNWLFFIWNIPPGVTNLIHISVFIHNQNTLREKFYYVATSFDPEIGSSSCHYKRIPMFTETKYHTRKLEAGDLQTVVFSFCIHSYPCIMTWCWPDFRVENNCHVMKLFAKWVLVVLEKTDRCYKCTFIYVTKLNALLSQQQQYKLLQIIWCFSDRVS